MQGIATATLAGNLTRDPEVKTLPGGTSVCEFGIAVNRPRKQGDEYVDEVSFFDVTVWSGFGELVGRKLKKGDAATVHGRLEQQRWETQEGESRSKVRIIADQIVSEGFFRSKDEDNDVQSAPAAQEAKAGDAQQTIPAPADDDIPF